MKIAITGSSAHLASVLLPILCARKDVSEIVGIDIKPTNFSHPKFQQHILDIRNKDLSITLKGSNVLIHLAFIVLCSTLKKEKSNRDLIRDINVNGSINVFTQATQLGIKKIIHLSSAVVYGAWPSNPNQITETQNRKVMGGFSYAEDKNAVEDWIENHITTSDSIFIRLRPHVILGPYSQPFLISLIKQPFYPYFANPQPLTQCIWEDDVASAINHSIDHKHSSTFNLAADPPMSFKAMIKASHSLAVPLPMSIVTFIHKLLWRFSEKGEEPGWLEGVPHSLTISSDKAKKELNWTPRYSTEECIRKTKNLH